MFVRTALSRHAFAALAIALLGATALTLGSAHTASAAVSLAASGRSVASSAPRPAAPKSSVCNFIVVFGNEFQRCTGTQWLEQPCLENTNYNGSNGPFNVLAAANGCGFRVWLHQDAWNGSNWGSGWSFCISKGKGEPIPAQNQHPLNIYISSNTTGC
jgi:hypothetical protein